MDIEGDVWADGEQDALAEIAALSGTRRRARAPCHARRFCVVRV
jgi:hypothetical protein